MTFNLEDEIKRLDRQIEIQIGDIARRSKLRGLYSEIAGGLIQSEFFTQEEAAAETDTWDRILIQDRSKLDSLYQQKYVLELTLKHHERPDGVNVA